MEPSDGIERTTPGRFEFPVLDTLRAVGAFAVLTTHTTFHSGDYTQNGYLGTLFGRLEVGVAIFFVLSGMLLARPYLARADRGESAPSLREYGIKRFWRIWPVYVVAVVLVWAAVPGNEDRTLGDWLISLAMVDTYANDTLPQGLAQMWSLSVEVAFYAILPLLMWVATGRLRRRTSSPPLSPVRVWGLLGAMVAISVVWHTSIAEPLSERTDGLVFNWLPGYLSWFAVGIAVAYAHVLHVERGLGAPRPIRALAQLGSQPGVCWTMAVGLMLLTATPLGGPVLLYASTTTETLFADTTYALVGGLVVLTGVFAAPDSTYARVMSLPALRHLGHISYSVFCLHMALLIIGMDVFGFALFAGSGWTIWAGTLLAALLVSELTYRLVELPGTRVASALIRRSRRSAAATSTGSSTAASIT